MKWQEFQEKLKILTKCNIKLVQLADILGIDKSGISLKKTRDKDVEYHELSKIAEYFNIPLSEFEENANTDGNSITVDHIHISPSCGKGTTVIDLPEITPITLGRRMIEDVLRVSKPENLKTFTACGDSMEDTIDDGNLLLVDTGRTDYQNGGIFILTINNEWYVKRLRKRISGQLDIISDNSSKYPVETYTEDDNIEIVVKGRVIKNLSKGL